MVSGKQEGYHLESVKLVDTYFIIVVLKEVHKVPSVAAVKVADKIYFGVVESIHYVQLHNAEIDQSINHMVCNRSADQVRGKVFVIEISEISN